MTDVGDVVIGVSGRVAGQVLDPDGAPVRGATVWVLGWIAEDRASVQVATDAQGRFAVEGIGSGTYDFAVMPPPEEKREFEPISMDGLTESQALTFQFNLRPDVETATLMIKIKKVADLPEASEIRISVLGDDGAVPRSGNSGNDVCTQNKLEIGKAYWVLGSSGNRWGRTGGDQTVGQNEIELSLDQVGSNLSATVVDDSTGKPVTKNKIQWSQDRSLGKSWIYSMGQVATDLEGRFEIEGLAPDLPVWLQFDHPDYEHRVVEIPMGQSSGGTIKLVPRKK
jgi:hypothetical protein